jgi:acetyl-CoA acetyltransferase
MSNQRVAIVAGARTPFVKAGRAFASVGPAALAKHAVRGLLDRHEVDSDRIDAIAFGAVVPEPGKPNLAREIVLEAGLSPRTEGQTISSYCITGLRTATIIADAIAAGRISAGIAGGVEWLSGSDPSTFNEPSTGLSMGQHTEITRKEWGISRVRQDEIALASHRNAVAARERLARDCTVRGRVPRYGSTARHVEAFAAQVLANAAAWEEGWKGPATDPVNWDRVNVNGSSIAIGHPWSATGGRILTTLAYEMARRSARYGLISMCAAGAMAGAFLLTRE